MARTKKQEQAADPALETGEVVETDGVLRREQGDRFQVHTTGWPDGDREGWQVAATARTVDGIEGLAFRVFMQAGASGAKIGKVRVHDRADPGGAMLAKRMLAKVRASTGGLAPRKR